MRDFHDMLKDDEQFARRVLCGTRENAQQSRRSQAAGNHHNPMNNDDTTNGMLYVLKECNAIFDRATMPPPPPIGTTDVITAPCPDCHGFGETADGPGGTRQLLYSRCQQCDGYGKVEHRFPSEIVKLAKALARTDELTIARTLVGLALGMTTEKGQP